MAIALALVACAPACAEKLSALHGVFGNVRMSAETGDQGGIELRLFEVSGKPMVEIVDCAGSCDWKYAVPVVRDGSWYRFAYDEMEDDGAGQLKKGVRYLNIIEVAGQNLKLIRSVLGDAAVPTIILLKPLKSINGLRGAQFPRAQKPDQ